MFLFQRHTRSQTDKGPATIDFSMAPPNHLHHDIRRTFLLQQSSLDLEKTKLRPQGPSCSAKNPHLHSTQGDGNDDCVIRGISYTVSFRVKKHNTFRLYIINYFTSWALSIRPHHDPCCEPMLLRAR